MANEAWQIPGSGGIKLTKLSEPVPQPGQNQVLVRIHSVSVNYRDLLVSERSPAYPLAAKSNLVPCSDGAGIVEATGPSSTWEKGDRVILCGNTWEDGDNRNFDFTKTLGGGDFDGTLRRWMVVDDSRLVRAPKNLSLVEASTLFTAGNTACRALFFGPIVADSNTTVLTQVLTQGTGGVSCYAIQLAAAVGATIISTSSSDSKLLQAGLLGASHTINYTKTPRWSEEVLRLTSGKGVDIVVEVGGSSTIEESLASTRYAGVIAVVGVLSESKPADLIPAILFGAKTVTGQLGSGSKEMFKYLVKMVEENDIHPPIARAFEFEEAKQAFAYTKTLTEVGKVVIKC